VIGSDVEPGNPQPPARPRIQIVEDEGIVALDLRSKLMSLGYEVIAICSTATDAAAQAAVQPPDVLLMDIRLAGGSDGIEAARRIGEQLDVPVVFVTAYADGATLARARQIAPYGYLVKPISVPELHSTLQMALHRHALDKTVREQRRWFSATLAAISDAVLTVDREGRVTYANPAACTLLDIDAEGARGRPIEDLYDLVDDDAGGPLANPVRVALAERRVVRLPPRATLVTAAGTWRAVIDGAAVILGEDGEPAGAVVSLTGDDDRRRLEQQLAAADRMAALGTLAASVGHEINNPLAYVLANLQHVAGLLPELGPDDNNEADDRGSGKLRRIEELHAAIADAVEGTRRIARVVADLQLFWRPGDDAPRPIDIAESVRWAARVTATRIRPRAQLIEVFGAAPPVSAPSGRIGQVLVNLITNAADAIEPGAPDRQRITVTTGADEHGRAVIEVADSGCGMSAEVTRHIFEPFFTTHRRRGGAGLGLSIVHRIVRELGGEISVASELGVGTTFRITLPASPTTAAVPAAAEVRTSVRARILVIDDEPALRTALRRLLQRDHDVVVADSADAGLALLDSGTFDAILCDVHMPGGSGAALAAELGRRRPELVDRLVFVTGGALSEDDRRALAAAANPPLLKPFNAADVLAAINDVLARPRLA